MAFVFPCSTLNMSDDSLLASKVSDEKSTDNLMGLQLCDFYLVLSSIFHFFVEILILFMHCSPDLGGQWASLWSFFELY